MYPLPPHQRAANGLLRLRAGYEGPNGFAAAPARAELDSVWRLSAGQAELNPVPRSRGPLVGCHPDLRASALRAKLRGLHRAKHHDYGRLLRGDDAGRNHLLGRGLTRSWVYLLSIRTIQTSQRS
jgi:hypothetical protein